MFLFADLLGLLDCGIWTGRVLGHVSCETSSSFLRFPYIPVSSHKKGFLHILYSIITWLLHWIALNYIELYWSVWVQGVMMSSGPLLKPGCGMGLWGLQHTGIRFDILLILLLLRFKRVWWHSKITLNGAGLHGFAVCSKEAVQRIFVPKPQCMVSESKWLISK